MIKTTLINKNIDMGVTYSFRGLVHYHPSTHGGIQANVVLAKKLRVLHLHPQETGSELGVTLGMA